MLISNVPGKRLWDGEHLVGLYHTTSSRSMSSTLPPLHAPSGHSVSLQMWCLGLNMLL